MKQRREGEKTGDNGYWKTDFDQAYLCSSSLPTIPVLDSKNIYGRKNIQSKEWAGHSGMKKMKVENSWRGGIKRLDSKKEFWRKVENTGDGLPSERNSMKKASLMWDPLPTTTTTPGYNCLPHFTSENRQASPLFLPSLSFSFSLSFSSPRPHIRFSSNTLTLSLLVEYEPTRALTLSHAFDKKHI